jgi:hypothetical protein
MFIFTKWIYFSGGLKYLHSDTYVIAISQVLEYQTIPRFAKKIEMQLDTNFSNFIQHISLLLLIYNSCT